MTHPFGWHDSFICVTWLIHTCDITNAYVRHDSFICVTWLIQMCDMTHSYMWLDLFICVTCLIHMCDVTHSYVRHDSFIYNTWLIHMCDMYVIWHISTCDSLDIFDSLHTCNATRITSSSCAKSSGHESKWQFSCHTYERVMSHTNESCPTRMSHAPYEWVMSLHVNHDSSWLIRNDMTHSWLMSSSWLMSR